MVSSRWVLGSSKGIAAVLHQQHHEEADQDQPQRGRRRSVHSRRQGGPEHAVAGKVRRRARASTMKAKKTVGSARQEKVTSRAAPIPSKLEPVSRAAAGGEKACQAEEVDEEDQVAAEGDRGRQAAEGDEQGGQHRHRQPDHRPGAKDPGGGLAEDEALAQELQEIEVGLQQGCPDPAGEERPWSCRSPPAAKEKEEEAEADEAGLCRIMSASQKGRPSPAARTEPGRCRAGKRR